MKKKKVLMDFYFFNIKFELLSNEKFIQFDMDFPSHKSSLVALVPS